MTRLQADWIKDIEADIKASKAELKQKTGMDFVALAAAAAGLDPKTLRTAAENLTVAVIPVTTGLGIIGSFSDAVAAVARCMGFRSFVTEATDVAGIYEAHQRKATILFMADDNLFIALNLNSNRMAENSKCTALGYVAALEGFLGRNSFNALNAHHADEAAIPDQVYEKESKPESGILINREVLVIGCGVVGKEVLWILKSKWAVPIGWDIETAIVDQLKNAGERTLADVTEIADYRLIVDASSEGKWLKSDMLHPEALILTPGVPLSLDEEARTKFESQTLHDLLPIGVSVMLATVCKPSD